MATHTAMAQGSNPSMRDFLERNLGIIHFASTKEQGWSGQSRTRYTDFQVNELTKDGEVVHLSDFYNNSRELAKAASQGISTLPGTNKPSQSGKSKTTAGEGSTIAKREKKDAEENQNTEERPNTDETGTPPKDSISESDKTILVDLLGQTTTDELIAFYGKIQSNPKATAKVVGDVSIPAIADKARRSRIHGEIRRIFGGKIDTTTGSDDSIKATAVRSGANKQRGNRPTNGGSRNDRRNPTQGDMGPYLHFSLYKENKDTMDALNHMAKTLRIHPKAFGAAGTKDRRAVTVQRVSVKDRTPASLIVINERINSVKIGDFKYAQDPIRLNDHDGNEFVIVLKNCVFSGTENLDFDEKLRAATSIVDSAVKQVIQHGFINYYGTQRFGTHRIGTHEVGMKILKEDFAGAVQALLSYDPLLLQDSNDQGDAGAVNREDISRARACSTFLETKNSSAALSHLPPRCHVEKTLIQHLGKTPGDFVGALTSINRSMRTMYGHAYQSLVWNFVASKRWERFGAQVINGDIVLVKSKLATTQNTDHGRDIEAPVGWEEDITAVQQYGLVPHAVTEDDIQDGKYSIYDIVLPSPGWDVIYPPNEIGDFYVEFMGKPENGGLDPYNMRRRQRDFSLPGSYRKLMGTLKRVPTASVQAYSNDLEQLVPTDLDIIRSRKAKEAAERNPRQGDAVSSWTAFSHNAQQNEQEESKARVARRKAESPPPPPPTCDESWIQTSVDGSNKRIKIAKHSSAGNDEPGLIPSAEAVPETPTDSTQNNETADFGDNDQGMEIDGAPDEEPARKGLSPSIAAAVKAQPTDNEFQVESHGVPPQSASISGESATMIGTDAMIKQTTSTVDSHSDTNTDLIPISAEPHSSNGPDDKPSILSAEKIEHVTTVSTIPANPPQPQKIAVILRFALDTSQYATIVIRELQGTYRPKNDSAQAYDGPTPPNETSAEAV